MSEVIGTKVNDWDELEKAPGNWMFSLRSESDPVQGIGGIIYNCPCGCGRIGGFPFEPRHPQADKGAVWKWDGNEEKPSCTPSIRHIPHSVGPLATEREKVQAVCGWHGYLTAGVSRSC
jgi:hypothetical protein